MGLAFSTTPKRSAPAAAQHFSQMGAQECFHSFLLLLSLSSRLMDNDRTPPSLLLLSA
jgi:hypothetical protein